MVVDIYSQSIWLLLVISTYSPTTLSSFIDFSSELEIAVNLNDDAREQLQSKVYSTALICETWVFAWKSYGNHRILGERNYSAADEGKSIRSAFDGKQFFENLKDQFSYAHSNIKNYGKLVPIVLFAFDGSELLKTNFSYDQEFTDEDILQPSRFGFRRYTPNCVSQFIQVPKTEVGNELTDLLIRTKTGRPHKDFFFYIGKVSIVQELLSIEKFKDMRYKFAIMQPDDQIHTGNIWWNTCERQNEKLDLFSRKCDSLISNRHFLITACNIPTLVSYENNPDGSLKWGSGTVYAMFVETARRFNFTFHVRYAHFNGASGFKKNGKWYGAVGEVFSREADIACAVAPTVYRNVINDASITQVYMVRVFFILRPPYKTSWQSIYWPLTSSVWLITALISIFLVTPAFYFSAVAYMKSVHNRSHTNLLGEVIDALYRILMEQAATWRHWTGTRIRVLVLIWTFFCLVLRTGYSSKLIVFLSFLQQAPLPATHRELSLSTYKMFFRYYGGVAYHYTSISQDPMHKRILRKSILVNSSDECMMIALNNPHAACLDYRMGGEYAISKKLVLSSHENLELFIGSKDTDVKIHIIWSYRNGSPWIESFDKPLLNILAAGLYDMWKARDWYRAKKEGSEWVKKNPDIRNKLLKVKEGLSVGPKPLDLDSVFGVFMIMNVGCIASVLVFCLEYMKYLITKYLKTKKLTRRDNKVTFEEETDTDKLPN